MITTLRHTARRGALTLAALAFTAGGLTACGGGSDASSAPDDVSTDDFCSAYSNLLGGVAKASTGGDDAVVPAIKDFADKLSKLGTPSDIPDDARKGFEVSLDQVKDLPDDASVDDLQKLSSDISADDQKSALAFGTYVQKTCPDALKNAIPSVSVPTS